MISRAKPNLLRDQYLVNVIAVSDAMGPRIKIQRKFARAIPGDGKGGGELIILNILR